MKLNRLIGIMSLAMICLQAALCVAVMCWRSEAILHWNAKGEVDATGNAAMVVLLPVMSILLYVGLTFLQRHPQLFNYPRTFADKERAYNMMAEMLGWVKLVNIAIVTFIVVEVFNGDDMNMCVLAILFIIEAVIIFLYIRRLNKIE